MPKTLCWLALGLTFLSSPGAVADAADPSGEAFSGVMYLYQARGGLVRTPETAATIAEAVLANLYGEQFLQGQPPLYADDRGEFWLVTGSGNTPEALATGLGRAPDGTTDSAISIRVRKSDAAITYLDVTGPPLRIPDALRDRTMDQGDIDQGDIDQGDFHRGD